MTPCEIASELNQRGGGVKIPCHIAEPANTTDSKMEVGDVIKNKNTMAAGGRVKEDDVTDMMWTLQNQGRQSFNSPENIQVAEVLVDRGLAVKEGNEYGLTKTGEQELMAEGGHVPQSRIEDTDTKNSQCNCPTMAYHNRLSENQREKLGNKYLAEGSLITDNKTNLNSEIAEIEHNGFRLRPQSAFNGAPRQEFTVPFEEVIDRHESRDISIPGYDSSNPEDHKILILVVKDIMACNLIKDKGNQIQELNEKVYELGGRAEHLENRLYKRKMEAGGFVYETGANFDKVNGLILFADTTRNLAEMRDAVYATIKNRMSKGASPTKKELQDRFKTFLRAVRGQYVREMGNTSDAREEADLNQEEEQDFLRVYAEEVYAKKAGGGKLEIDPIEAQALQYWRRLNTKSKLSFLVDNAEDVLGEPLSKAPKNVQAEYKKLANKQFHSLPKEVHLALLEHVIKKSRETGGEIEGYESQNGENDTLIQDDIRANVDALIVLLDCTEDEGQRAKIREDLAEYGHHIN